MIKPNWNYIERAENEIERLRRINFVEERTSARVLELIGDLSRSLLEENYSTRE